MYNPTVISAYNVDGEVASIKSELTHHGEKSRVGTTRIDNLALQRKDVF